MKERIYLILAFSVLIVFAKQFQPHLLCFSRLFHLARTRYLISGLIVKKTMWTAWEEIPVDTVRESPGECWQKTPCKVTLHNMLRFRGAFPTRKFYCITSWGQVVIRRRFTTKPSRRGYSTFEPVVKSLQLFLLRISGMKKGNRA